MRCREGRGEGDVWSEQSLRMLLADTNLSAFPCLRRGWPKPARGGRKRTSSSQRPGLGRSRPVYIFSSDVDKQTHVPTGNGSMQDQIS